MRQNPLLRYGIVGDGRMARHMAHYLKLLGTPARLWSRRMECENGILPGVLPYDTLAECDVILLLISDGAIEAWIHAHPFLQQKRILHFSGALVSPLCAGFHPLMTFGSALYELETYESIAFVCETPGPEFLEIFPHLRNPHFPIAPALKPLYHSLCVVAGNFTVMLWQKLFEALPGRIGIPSEAAIPYLRQIADNLESNPTGALTGPIQRGDLKTIAANVQALEGDPFQAVYQAFVQTVVPPVRNGEKK